MSRRRKWWKRATVIVLVGVMAKMAQQIPGMVFHSPQPDLFYTTNELAVYPVTYHDGKMSLTDIQGSQLLRGPVKVIRVVVRNKGERSATGATARIIVPTRDDYLGGWITKSQDPSRVEMLGARMEWTSPKLMPGDSVTLDFYLKSVNSAYQIEVFDGDGRSAAHYPYLPVHDLGGDMVIFPLRKRWIFACALMLVLVLVIVLLAVAPMTRPEEPGLSASGQSPADAAAQPPSGSNTSTVGDEKRPDRPPRHWTAGGG